MPLRVGTALAVVVLLVKGWAGPELKSALVWLAIGSGRYGRVRNPGHAGYEVEKYRVIGGGKELLSVDNYPVMHRITEYRPK